MCKLLIEYLYIKRSRLFDHAYYLSNYPDVRRSDIDPLWHYITLGWREGRNPSQDFSASEYLEQDNLSQTSVNPLVHYLKNTSRS